MDQANSVPTASQRKQRLRDIAHELQVTSKGNLEPLKAPGRPPSFRIPDDERKADVYLGQLRIEEVQANPQPSGFRRAFSANKSKSLYTYEELNVALARVIEDDGEVGVAEVLLTRFKNVGGDTNLARRGSTSVIKKITNGERPKERGYLLQTAAEKVRLDLVQILSPYADTPSLDESLSIALTRKHVGIVETLLQRGANPINCKAQFQRVAGSGDDEIDTLQLLLRAPKRVPAHFIIDSLLPAATAGSLGAVMLLMRSGANGDHESASALMHAVETGHDDIAAAIVMSPSPPSPESLDRAISKIFAAATANLHDKHLLVEVLLCGGPQGNAANEGLFKATMFANVEMMQLLLEYGADVNYNNASALVHAIHRSRDHLVGYLLQNQNLSPGMASQVVSAIPRNAPPTVKIAILSKLLLYGASGAHCSELLINAAETDDMETATLLLSFHRDHNKPPVAAVDYNAARCLQAAVSRNNQQMVNLLVQEGHPSQFSLAKVFPMIPKIDEKGHFRMVESLLKGGAHGPEVDSALFTAVTGPHRSKRLIDLLVHNGATVNETTLLKTVSQGNPEILQILLMGNPSGSACSAAISEAIKLPENMIRFQIMQLLLPYAVDIGVEGTVIAQAVINLLENSPEDLNLLQLLCQVGRADINYHNGEAVTLATDNANPLALDFVLQSAGGIPTPDTVARGLTHAMELPLTNSYRHRKVEALLRKAKPQNCMDYALIQEIKRARNVGGDLSVIEALLAAGADVNAEKAAPVCWAVKDPAIMDLLLARRPTTYSLSKAFPLAVTLPDPERYNLCGKLLKAGAAGEEVSKALFEATKEGPPAIPFMRLLLPQADVNYNAGCVLRLAARQGFSEAINLLLTQRPIMPTNATKMLAFQEAMKIRSIDKRYTIIKKLLVAGVKGDFLSSALLSAVNFADVALAELLLQSGASVEYDGGKAVHSAASSGNNELLQLLVKGTHGLKPSQSVLTMSYGGATALKDRNKDSYYQICKTLLEVGLRGEAVDAALVDAVKEGDHNFGLIELMYNYGASVEWHEGEAIDIATQMASIRTLTLLLGTRPSQDTLKRAYRSSLNLIRDIRYTVIDLIMRAGKSVDKHVTNTLLLAAQEDPVDRKLINLLLSFEAFDEGQSMAHAACVLDLQTLKLLIECPKGEMFTSFTFKEAMRNGIPWQSKQGLSIMELLLIHGAAGEDVGTAVLEAVERCQTPNDAFAKDFLNLLLRLNPDVNYQRGIVLQRATQQANIELLEKLMPGANSESKAMAFPYIFRTSWDETLILRMIGIFTDTMDEQRKLDVSFDHPDPDLEPVLFMALKMFPRKTQVLKALLDAGFSHEQWHIVDTEYGQEQLTILCWALYQPERKISSANIALLIDAGANVNFISKSHITPVMLSIENERPDVLESLILKGAKVTIPDEAGITPLALASKAGNALVMTQLLKAGAAVDDGSLHDAARELRVDAIRVLIKYGHEPDFPSDRHDGRSALAELCFKAVDNGTNPDLEEAIVCLIAAGSDYRLRFVGRKTIFHYALDSSDPVSILKVLLKHLWKSINEDCYLYTDGQHTYSLTKYVEKGICLGPEIQNREVIQLLKNKMAQDRFWADSIDVEQPLGYCGAPEYIKEEVMRQRVRAKRESELREDVSLQIEMKRQLAIEEGRIMKTKTDQEIGLEFEKARAQERILTSRADQQLRLDNRAEMERQRLARIRQLDDVNHMKAIGEAQVATQRNMGQARIETSQTEHMLEIEYEEAKNVKMNEGVRARLAIEGSAMDEKDRILKRHHDREMARMKTQKALVESTMSNLRSAGANQKQIGYILGEEP